MTSFQTAKILNIFSFVVLALAIILLMLTKRNEWSSVWTIYALLLALLLKMASFYAKNKALEKENAELRKDLKNLTRILEEKIK